jgi:hypothetical protein
MKIPTDQKVGVRVTPSAPRSSGSGTGALTDLLGITLWSKGGWQFHARSGMKPEHVQAILIRRLVTQMGTDLRDRVYTSHGVTGDRSLDWCRVVERTAVGKRLRSATLVLQSGFVTYRFGGHGCPQHRLDGG